MNLFKGIGKVFYFTMRMTTMSKGWRAVTIVLALILFLVPLTILAGIEFFADEEVPYSGSIGTVYVVDQTDGDWMPEQLSLYDERFADIIYISCGTYEEAAEKVHTDSQGVVLCITAMEDEYSVDMITPDDSAVTEPDADHYLTFIDTIFPNILAQKSGVDMTSLAYSMMPVTVHILNEQPSADDAEETEEDRGPVYEILSIALPYVTVMFMYFFVLFYGQSCAQLVVMEKTSKLMDTILVTVKPAAMIFGKIFAGILCAVAQLSLWIIALLLGLSAGGYAAQAINPQSTLNIFKLIRESGIFEGMFTPAGIILSLLIIVSGCLLYCSLASIGGALAGKQEDLQSTNILFTMALVISFMVVIFGGNVMTTGEMASAGWMHFVPFTSVLITPSRVLIGDVSLLTGTASLLITILFCALIMLFAGRLYTMMSFYKGNPPKLMQIFGKMVK